MAMEQGVGEAFAHPLFTLAFILFLAFAAVSDLRARRIPNPLVAGIALLAVAQHLLLGGVAALLPSWHSAIVFVLATSALLLLFSRDALGAGDVKLLLAALLYVGGQRQSSLLLLVALFGGLLAAGYLSLRCLQQSTMGGVEPGGRETSLPYGVAIASGAILLVGGDFGWIA